MISVPSVDDCPRVGTYTGLKIVEPRRPARRPVCAGCARVCGGRESEQGPGRSPRKFLHHGPKPDEEAGEPGIERLGLGCHLLCHGRIRTFTIGVGICLQFFWVGHNTPSGSATESPRHALIDANRSKSIIAPYPNFVHSSQVEATNHTIPLLIISQVRLLRTFCY